MEELDHDLLPGPALQSSQRGDAGLVRLTVLVSPAVVWVLRLGDSAGPQVGPAHWRAQPGLTGLGTVGVLTARPSCRSSVRSGQTPALSYQLGRRAPLSGLGSSKSSGNSRAQSDSPRHQSRQR